MKRSSLAVALLAFSLLACGTAPQVARCSRDSDCVGDAVCGQNLCQQGYRLTATTTGDGGGRVTSSPDRISCPGVCSAPFAVGEVVTLQPTPDPNSDFMGWSGDCSGTANCTVSMDAGRAVSAVFRSNRVVFTSALKLDGSDAANTSTNSNIWRVNADGTGLAPLTKATAASSVTPRSSPDGRQIAFASALKLDGSDAANTSTTANIWRINADGTELTPLTRATASGDTITNMSPEWSPDGKRIVFTSTRSIDGSDAVNPASNLWLVNADGTGLTPITKATVTGAGSTMPQWSADGTRIVFSSSLKLDGTNAANVNSTSNIWRINADGSGLTPLTTATATAADSAWPQWSPDGTRVVFSSALKLDGTDAVNSNNTTNVWRINADGAGLTPFTAATLAGTSSIMPRWSPDGTQIVFTSFLNIDGSNTANVGGTANVWRINADGTNRAPLTRATASGDTSLTLFPRWSLDGARIIFTSALKLDGSNAANPPNSTSNVWRVSPDGGGLLPLTRATASGAASSSCSSGNVGELSLLELVVAMAWMRRRRRRL